MVENLWGERSVMKKIFQSLIIISLALMPTLCFAVDLNSTIPTNFPRQKPIPKVYSERATIQAFYDNWAENIGNDIKIKSFETEFTGIGYKQEITNDFFPKWNLPKTANQDFITCNLYSGIFNSTAYKRLKTPLLYDEEHNICVAATAVRDYSNTDIPYFEEPSMMRNIVSISGYFPDIPPGSIKLKEIALIPSTAQDEKKIEKYVKETMKLYKNFLRAEELGVSIDKVPSKFSQTLQKGLVDIIECTGGLLLNP
ncbi:MAG: hypothetical protein ACLSWI_06085 [Candidatus Gastranaerophilaceae bacterium]